MPFLYAFHATKQISMSKKSMDFPCYFFIVHSLIHNRTCESWSCTSCDLILSGNISWWPYPTQIVDKWWHKSCGYCKEFIVNIFVWYLFLEFVGTKSAFTWSLVLENLARSFMTYCNICMLVYFISFLLTNHTTLMKTVNHAQAQMRRLDSIWICMEFLSRDCAYHT